MAKILSVQMVNGVKITKCAYVGPRRGERTFPPIFGSISNTGAKAVNLAKCGIYVKRGV